MISIERMPLRYRVRCSECGVTAVELNLAEAARESRTHKCVKENQDRYNCLCGHDLDNHVVESDNWIYPCLVSDCICPDWAHESQISTCDNCGQVDHTDDEYKVCYESIVAPPKEEE